MQLNRSTEARGVTLEAEALALVLRGPCHDVMETLSCLSLNVAHS
jgi:hypothetical protein